MSDEDERRIAEIEADLREQARYSVVIGTIDGLPGWVTFAFPPAHTGGDVIGAPMGTGETKLAAAESMYADWSARPRSG